MASVYARGTVLWIAIQTPQGRVARGTSYRVGQEALAREVATTLEARAQQPLPELPEGPLTVAGWADVWISQCRKLGMRDWEHVESRLRLHVLPTLGQRLLTEVTARDLVLLFADLRSGDMAPKTIRNIYGAIQGLYSEALTQGLCTGNPCCLKRNHLGPIRDKDPEWRRTAIFTREELIKLTTDTRIPPDRRIMYALEGIAGLRHGEAAGLRWRHHEDDLLPLGRLRVVTSYDTGRTKTESPREVPVHARLAELLGWWRRSGWAEMMGRTPTPDDLVVPCPARPRIPAGHMRDKNYSRKRLMEDLEALGLRHRRGHDLRRTMISLTLSDQANRSILECCTHSPGGTATAIQQYTTYGWDVLCGEIAKLQLPNLLVRSAAA